MCALPVAAKQVGVRDNVLRRFPNKTIHYSFSAKYSTGRGSKKAEQSEAFGEGGQSPPSQSDSEDVKAMIDQDRFRQDLERLRETIVKAGDAL